MIARSLLMILAVIACPAAARDRPQAKPTPKPLIASIDGLPLGEIPRQQLPATGCAAYLWSDGITHALVAMAGADPAMLRLSIDGALTDVPRVAQQGPGGFGFDTKTTYRAGDVTAILELTIETRADLTQGAAVPNGTLTLERPNRDTVILPIGGLIGCAAGTQGGTP
ncbi:MAG TPA: hypothetical protein VF404_04490 [Sphingomonas sp.]